MRSLVRLRIELDDRPGALAGIAAAIAGHDGNITAIDVLEADGGRAIDEITVDVPGDLDLALLRSEIAGVSNSRVLSHQRAQFVDPIVRVLRRLTTALDSLPDGLEEELAQGVADLCATPSVVVLDAEAAGDYDVGRHALGEPGRAVMAHVPELSLFGEALTGEATVVAVATSVCGAPVVVMAGRAAAHGFTPTECHRIEALVMLHERLSGVVDSAHEEARRPGVR